MKLKFKKGSPVKSKKFTLDINPDITGLEQSKTYKYLEINEAKSITSPTINKEKSKNINLLENARPIKNRTECKK